jgi:hypothetical protein
VSITPRHIPFPQLVDLIEGRLSPHDQSQTLRHVSGCAHCGAEAAWLERVIGLMRTDDSEDAPPYMVAYVSHMFRSRAAPDPPNWRRIVASLRFDSAKLPLAIGIRAGVAAMRQLLFYAEGHELDLRVTPTGSLWVVSGQLLGPEGSGQVELQSPTGSVHTVLNDLCEFTLPAVPPGSYRLTLRLANLEIEVAWLEVGW